MLDEITDQLFENTVIDAEDEVRHIILDAIRDILAEHDPVDATSDQDIYDWIDIVDITTDAFHTGMCYSDIVSGNIDNLIIYTKDCNDIICDYGFQAALELYIEYVGSIDPKKPPSEMEVAAQILYECYYPNETDVIFAVADNILGSCELDELVLKFKKGLITPKEDTEE
jgi:hypothetical protein